jgi:toxin ParE1/3/4
MQVVWSRRAVDDLCGLRRFIAEDNPEAAARVSARILEAVDTLAAMPNMGRPGRVFGTRELVIRGTPCILPYRVKGERLEIIAVLHASRQWPGPSAA